MTHATAEPHFLIVADEDDLPFLRSALSRLPEGAYGQMFLECERATHAALDLPQGVTLTTLPRGQQHVSRGERAVDALRGWMGEWFLLGEEEPNLIAWLGCVHSPAHEELHAVLHAGCWHAHRHHPDTTEAD